MVETVIMVTINIMVDMVIIILVVMVAMVIRADKTARITRARDRQDRKVRGERQDRQILHFNLTFQVTCARQLPQYLQCFSFKE